MPTASSAADKLLLLTLVLALAGLYFYVYQPKTGAEKVAIHIGNELYLSEPLNQQKTINVTGELGDSVVEIDHGKVRFLNSPCRNKVCIHHGWAEHNGEVVACLPNRVTLSVSGSKELVSSQNEPLDAVNF